MKTALTRSTIGLAAIAATIAAIHLLPDTWQPIALHATIGYLIMGYVQKTFYLADLRKHCENLHAGIDDRDALIAEAGGMITAIVQAAKESPTGTITLTLSDTSYMITPNNLDDLDDLDADHT